MSVIMVVSYKWLIMVDHGWCSHCLIMELVDYGELGRTSIYLVVVDTMVMVLVDDG